MALGDYSPTTSFVNGSGPPYRTAAFHNTQEAKIGELDGAVKSHDDALPLKAPLASPALTGVPTAPTASLGTNTTQLATTGFVQQDATALAIKYAIVLG